MTEATNEVVLSDGTRMVVEVSYPVIVVQRWRGGAVLEQLELPFPRAGVGGARLLTSPSERWLLLSLY